LSAASIAFALFRQGFLQGHYEFDAHEFFTHGAGERQRGLCGQRPASIRARGARGTVGGYDVPEPDVAAAEVAGLGRDRAQLVARLHGRVQRLRVVLHEGFQHGARLRGITGFVVQFRRAQGRLALDFGVSPGACAIFSNSTAAGPGWFDSV